MTIGWSFIENFENDSQLYKHKTKNVSEQKRCTTNEKYDSNTNSCVPCESGTYQSADNHTFMNCKIKDDLKLNGYNHIRPGQNYTLSKIENKKSLDECRQHLLDEKSKGNADYNNVIMIGHRNENHDHPTDPTYKNTCWYYRNNPGNTNTTVNAIDSRVVNDNIHTMACVDSDGNPIECNTSKENCDGMRDFYYSASDNLCIRKTQSCSPGTYFSGYGDSGNSNDPQCTPCGAGTYQDLSGQSSCTPCGAGTYQDLSGQLSCSDQTTCPNGQQLVGVPRDHHGNLKTGSTSAGTCQLCPGGKYKNSGQNGKLCEDQHTCPNGQQLVGVPRDHRGNLQTGSTSAGTCQWCPGGKYKNSGQNRNECSICGSGQYQNNSGQSGCKPKTTTCTGKFMTLKLSNSKAADNTCILDIDEIIRQQKEIGKEAKRYAIYMAEKIARTSNPITKTAYKIRMKIEMSQYKAKIEYLDKYKR